MGNVRQISLVKNPRRRAPGTRRRARATHREPPAPVAFPPGLESWRTASGLDHVFLTGEVLAEINFCLFCGSPAEPWEFRCADCRRRCLDPDCHRSAASRPERPCEDCEAGPGGLSCPPATVHGTSLRPPSGVEMYCPCCLRGCRCRGPFQARGNIGEGGLADLTEKDLRRFRGTNVVGDGLSCFVYRYRLPGGRAEFGMTYSPVRRTDQRRLDRTVNLIDPGFMKRLPGLDWLSARLPCRHWAYVLDVRGKASHRDGPRVASGGRRTGPRTVSPDPRAERPIRLQAARSGDGQVVTRGRGRDVRRLHAARGAAGRGIRRSLVRPVRKTKRACGATQQRRWRLGGSSSTPSPARLSRG